MADNSLDIKIEELVLKARELGIIFKNGPATFETIHDNKIFHVLEEMSDEVFYDTLLRKVEEFESKKFLNILNKYQLINDVAKPTFDESDSKKETLLSEIKETANKTTVYNSNAERGFSIVATNS